MVKPNKTTIETVKTVLIAVLITAIIAFIGGMQFNAKQNAQADALVKAAQTSKN